MNYWHMQLHPNENDNFPKQEILKILKEGVIGLGEWKKGESQIQEFKNVMKIGDIVLIRGDGAIALVEVTGSPEYINLIPSGSSAWFENRRKVKVLGFYESYKNKLPAILGTAFWPKTLTKCSSFSGGINDSFKVGDYIKEWYKIIKNEAKMTYQQKILFGSPGTGKSHKIDQEIIPDELEIKTAENVIKTVFHPEYTYGDFVGKLVPITRSGKVEYNFYEGHFLKALAQAYKNIIAAHHENEKIENVALVIDEINRGNSAAIFGTSFQLLDRNPDGWSSYDVSVNEITFTRLFELCDLKPHSIVQGKIMTYKFGNEEIPATTLQTKLNCHFENRTLKIPPNLSILASMNTSDSSIYYMDSAFKRRWEWEFIDIDSESISAEGVAFKNRDEWINFVGKLNRFIKSNHKYIRGIEDKQIGHYFITGEPIQKATIQNKLMFFLWDSVFNRDKKPLINLLFGDNKEDKGELITFGDFAEQIDLFIKIINERNV